MQDARCKANGENEIKTALKIEELSLECEKEMRLK